MGMMLAVMLSAAPASCEALWPVVWKAYASQELAAGKPPLFRRLPNAKELLGRAWIVECGAFTEADLNCTRGVTYELELSELRRSLEKEKMPAAEIERLIQKLRSEWSVLRCREADRALDRAGAAVERRLDAGSPM